MTGPNIMNPVVLKNARFIWACSLMASEGNIEQLVVILAQEAERLHRAAILLADEVDRLKGLHERQN